MTVKLHAPVEGLNVGDEYDGDREDWYVVNGYASYTDDMTDSRLLTGVVASDDPTLAVNREAPAKNAGGLANADDDGSERVIREGSDDRGVPATDGARQDIQPTSTPVDVARDAAENNSDADAGKIDGETDLGSDRLGASPETVVDPDPADPTLVYPGDGEEVEGGVASPFDDTQHSFGAADVDGPGPEIVKSNEHTVEAYLEENTAKVILEYASEYPDGVAELIEAEKAGKNRTSLIAALEKLQA